MRRGYMYDHSTGGCALILLAAAAAGLLPLLAALAGLR